MYEWSVNLSWKKWKVYHYLNFIHYQTVIFQFRLSHNWVKNILFVCIVLSWFSNPRMLERRMGKAYEFLVMRPFKDPERVTSSWEHRTEHSHLFQWTKHMETVQWSQKTTVHSHLLVYRRDSCVIKRPSSDSRGFSLHQSTGPVL